MIADENEIHELRQRTSIMVCWKARAGHGTVTGDSVRIRDPATGRMTDTNDAELAVILAMWRRHEIAVIWPFNCILSVKDGANVIDRSDPDRRPMTRISDRIEEAARFL